MLINPSQELLSRNLQITGPRGDSGPHEFLRYGAGTVLEQCCSMIVIFLTMEFRVRSTAFIVRGVFGLAQIGTRQRFTFDLKKKNWSRLRTMLIAWYNPGSPRLRTTLP